MGELVDHGQALELLPVGARIEDEVVGPNVICCSRRQRPGSAGRQAPPRTLTRQPEAGLPPDTTCPIYAHRLALTTQEDPDPPVAVARILRRQSAHRAEHRRVLLRLPKAIAQGRSRYSEQPTGAPLRYPAFADQANLIAAHLWAHHFFRFTSRITSSSRSRSASRRLSLAFSDSSDLPGFFGRLISGKMALQREGRADEKESIQRRANGCDLARS